MRLQTVHDRRLGPLLFPAQDAVMAPAISASGEWEPEEIRWLCQQVQPGMTCVNVGANVGYFSSWMSRLTGPDGQVFAFEPNPVLLPLLRENLANAAYPNVEIIPAAGGAQEGS